MSPEPAAGAPPHDATPPPAHRYRRRIAIGVGLGIALIAGLLWVRHATRPRRLRPRCLRWPCSRQQLLDATVHADREILGLTRARYQLGIGAQVEVVQAELTLQTALVQFAAIAQQRTAVGLAQQALALERTRYETGIDPYLALMTQQTALLAAQQALVTLEVQQMTAAVRLVQALGGGWNRSVLPTPGQVSRAPAGPPLIPDDSHMKRLGFMTLIM